MKPHDKNLLTSLGKRLAGPLSGLFVNSWTEKYARLGEMYLSVLLGKGAGTGWGIATEHAAAARAISVTEPVLFDVGANHGEWSRGMARRFPKARFFLFEPQPDLQAELRQSGLPNMTLFSCGVSARDGVVDLFVSNRDDGVASIHERRDSWCSGSAYSRIRIPTVALDDIIAAHHLTRVDFVKLDIEGHELEALKGASSSLESGVIRALSFEFGSGNINARTYFHDFWDMLTPLRFVLYRILPSGRMMKIDEYYEDCECFRGATNYVAVLGGMDSVV